MFVGGAADDSLLVTLEGDATGLEGALAGAKGAITSLKTVALTAFAAIGGAATLYLGNATSAAADFEEQLIDIERVLDDASGMDQLEEDLLDIARTTPLTIDELTSVGEQLARLGVDAEDIPQVTEWIAMLGATTDMTADEAADSMPRIATAFGIPMDEIDGLAHAIVALGANFGTTESEMMDVMVRAGPMADLLGLNEDQALGLAAAMNEVSPTSRLAAGGLERMMEAVMDPSNIELWAELLGKSTDEIERMKEEEPEELLLRIAEAAHEDQEAFNLLNDELGVTSQDFATLGSNTDDAREAMDMANDEADEGSAMYDEFDRSMEGVNAKLQILRNRLEIVAIQIGQVLLPAFEAFIDILIDAVDFIIDLNEATSGWAGTLAGLTAMVGGFAAGLKLLASQSALVAGALGSLKVAISALGGPITLIIGLTAALAAAWITDFMGIRTATQNLLNFLQETFGPVIESALEQVERAVGTLTDFWEEQWSEWEPIVTDVWETIQTAIEEALTLIENELIGPTLEALEEVWRMHGEELTQEATETWNHIEEIIVEFWEWLRPYLEAANEFMRETIVTALDEIREFWDRWGDDILTVVEFVFDGIVTAVEFAMDGLLTGIRATLAIIRGDWGEAWELVRDLFSRQMDRILDFASEWGGRFLDWLGGVLDDAIQSFLDWGRELIGASIIPDIFNAILDFIGETMEEIWDTIDEVLSDILTDIENWATDVYDEIESMVRDIASWIQDTGSSVMGNAWESMAQSAVDAFNRVIPDTIEFPEVTVGGGGFDVPEIEVGGETYGGGSLDVPTETFGGETWDLPQLHEGGVVDRAGIAEIHEGEHIVPADVSKGDLSDLADGSGDIIIKVESIDASSYGEGRAAAHAFKDELRSKNFD